MEQFKTRVYSFEYHSLYLDHDGCFHTNQSLNKKVDPVGKLKSYSGNTVVFALNPVDTKAVRVRNRLIWMQNVMYERCQELFSERLNRDTLHMTLHDLLNGRPEDIAEKDICFVRNEVMGILEAVHKETWYVKLKTTCVFNMVNSSIVLGFQPCSETDCNHLMHLYERMEEIVPLGYPLTPHITLAYFRPGMYDSLIVKNLDNVFKILSEKEFAIEFATKDLIYQEFYNMNHYTTPNISC